MLAFVRSKSTAMAAATLILAGWGVASGVASADPHGPLPGPTPAPPPGPPPASAPAPKTIIDHDGVYAVGTDIVPGTYSSPGPVGNGTCYWKRLGNAATNDIIDNAMTRKPQVVRIEPTDKAFKTDGCQPWQKNDAASPDPVKPPGPVNWLEILGGLSPSGGQPPKP
ncbi:MAG: hypothetical protein ACRDSX_04265 [Mycobacterium sp.]